MKVNNIKNEITQFLKDFCIEVKDNEEDSYVELMMDNHKCIEYEGKVYYVPDDCSLMEENDELLKQMLLATFPYEL